MNVTNNLEILENAVLDQLGCCRRGASEASWFTVWVAAKIIHYVRTNVRHFIQCLRHWCRAPQPPATDFLRSKVKYTAVELDVADMVSSYVDLWGTIAYVDQFGRGVIKNSGYCTPTSLTALVQEVQDLGATITHSATYNLASGRLIGECEKVEVHSGDYFAFVCEMGRNRSVNTQTLIEETGVGINCFNPHGAIAHDVLHDGDYHSLVRGLTYLKSWLTGRVTDLKKQRVGRETYEMSRTNCRKWMDNNYYGKIAERRATVVTYDHGFHSTIFRLACWAKCNGRRLDGVTIVPIKVDDPSFLGLGRSWPQFYSCVRELFNCHVS